MAAELDNVIAAFEQLLTVAQTSGGILAGNFEAGQKLLGFHITVLSTQFISQVANLHDHGVGGEKGVQLLVVLKSGSASNDTFQDTVGRGYELIHAPLTLIGENLLLGAEARHDLFALGVKIFQKGVEFAEFRFQFFQGEQQRGKRLVYLLRGVGKR